MIAFHKPHPDQGTHQSAQDMGLTRSLASVVYSYPECYQQHCYLPKKPNSACTNLSSETKPLAPRLSNINLEFKICLQSMTNVRKQGPKTEIIFCNDSEHEQHRWEIYGTMYMENHTTYRLSLQCTPTTNSLDI